MDAEDVAAGEKSVTTYGHGRREGVNMRVGGESEGVRRPPTTADCIIEIHKVFNTDRVLQLIDYLMFMDRKIELNVDMKFILLMD
ncbi:hypothetical protein L1987_12637 [Smallanthus sonchifolius]|uniref:Uncharacterized protein n=1 Tax=Smallanthus sonchifolius TaxID=185202 RepID=A0ACB9JGH8_9ASTR|nr:hypothetical protein L1987_12637 [Smallanthus sonchifolius]